MIINRNNTMNMRRQIGDALSTYAYKSSDQTLIGAAFADVTGTGLAVVANAAYEFEFQLIADADASTTGIDVACNGPSAPTAIHYTQEYWGAVGPSLVFRPATAYDSDTLTLTSAGTTRAIYAVRGILINGANAGTLIARIKREAVGTGPNVRAGSFGRIRRLA
jgi:hypothetical protein